ncbi:MAG: type II toxin-antitoxin system Phd/YefM family antitoxin [Armatimonadetes bacterium]|nr:type II toxin-antitoxin system Phd/YefM family antitoxin [Armatimonadota bacterium]
MRFVTVRELHGRSAEVWVKLSEEKDLIVTSNGKPIALMSAVSEDSLEGSLAAMRRARAEAAVAGPCRSSRRALERTGCL